MARLKEEEVLLMLGLIIITTSGCSYSLALPPSTEVSSGSLKEQEVIHQSIGNYESDPKSPGVYVNLLKKPMLEALLKSKGPDAYVFRKDSVLFLSHRVRRQTTVVYTGGGGGSPPAPNPNPGGSSTKDDRKDVLTPVLPINGEKQFNDTDCMPWPEVAAIIRSKLKIHEKSQYIDPRSCNINEGLECVPFEERGVEGHRCQCMLVYGPKALYTDYIDNTGRTHKNCFIPAGLGWPSECQGKSYNDYGYPLPFGDPVGTNAEAAAQVDSFFEPDGEELLVVYIPWNSIRPECVPNAECREKGTYRGQRCQCKQGHLLEKPEGKCSGAGGMDVLSSGAWFSTQQYYCDHPECSEWRTPHSLTSSRSSKFLDD